MLVLPSISVESVIKQLLALLADDGLLVPALNVVPDNPVPVEVVEDADAGLVLASLPLLPVVRLSLLQSATPRPVAEPTAPRGRDPLPRGRPVPALLYNRLQVRPVATSKIACGFYNVKNMDL